MKCFSKEMLFHYIHEELSKDEMATLSGHISECEKCRLNLELSQKRILHVSEALQNLDPTVIPKTVFIVADNNNNKDECDRSGFMKTFSKLNPLKYMLAHPKLATGFAMIIICLMVAVSNKHWMRCGEEMVVPEWMQYDLYFDSDAETDWNEKRLIITIIDESSQKAEIIQTSLHKENVTRHVVGIDRTFEFVED